MHYLKNSIFLKPERDVLSWTWEDPHSSKPMCRSMGGGGAAVTLLLPMSPPTLGFRVRAL